MTTPRYRSIVDHYEACLERYGDSHFGVDWPNADDAATRHRVMLDVIRQPPDRTPVRLLDFGCGASHLYEYLVEHRINDIHYAGLDLSERFIELSRAKYPFNDYWCLDVLVDDPGALGRFDYAIMNGLFTEKADLSFHEMFTFFRQIVATVFSLVDVGLAFNTMSKHVDWERDDLFHLPFEVLTTWLTRDISRNFVLRSDYGLYEYTTYVYR